MQRADFLVHEAAGHLGEPVIDAGEEAENRAANQHVVEVRDDEIGIVQVDVHRNRGDDDTGDTSDGEGRNRPQREEHRRIGGNRTPHQRRQPVENLDPGRHRHQHCRQHHDEAEQWVGPGGEHVVAVDNKRNQPNRDHGVNHGCIAENRAPRESGDHVGDYAEGGENQDVDLGVAEIPEEVLPQYRVGARFHREVEGAKGTVGVEQD